MVEKLERTLGVQVRRGGTKGGRGMVERHNGKKEIFLQGLHIYT